MDDPNLSAVPPMLTRDLIQVEKSLAAYVSDDSPEISETVLPLVKRGGKRLRPILTILSSQICGPTSDKRIAYACIVELLHTASLFHDDVIDEATTRRGAESANHLMGNHLAVLAGDYLYLKALDLILQESEPIRKVVTKTVLAMTEGEILQAQNSFKYSNSLDTYMIIIEKKTAVLMSLSCRLGASISGTDQQIRNLSTFGLNLGIAFQLIDDLLDWTGEELVCGKKPFQDVREGRITLPALLLIQALTGDEKQTLIDFLTNRTKEIDETIVQHYREKIQEFSIDRKVRSQAENRSMTAIRQLENFQPSPELDYLKSLPLQLVERIR